MIVKKLLLVMAVFLIPACAYSPQQVTINPQIDAGGESYGNGRSIAVTARDERDNKTLGTRGGIYKDTSTITIANDLPRAVVRAAKAKLATQGFDVNAQQSNADLAVIIEKLTYDIPEQSLVKKVDLHCVLRVEVTAGGEKYTGRYQTTSEQQTLVTPSMARNQAMINKVISDTLERAFSDPKLKAFLSNI